MKRAGDVPVVYTHGCLIKSAIFWDITPYSPSETQPTFRSNILYPFSESKNKPMKKAA
jgi:hypothetical protein